MKAIKPALLSAILYVLVLALIGFKHAYNERSYINMVFSASSVLVIVSLIKVIAVSSRQ